MTTKMKHVDDWLDEPAKDEAEKFAKEFLEHCRRPAINKDHVWIGRNPLFCAYEGKAWRVLGASRLGDVWLAADFTHANGYDLRVDVAKCSRWSRTPSLPAVTP